MIYLELIWGFLKVGLFSFGGAYGAIPVIREVVMANGWVTEEKFAYLLAISESTPGPIMVNTATYIGNEVGSKVYGIWGGLLGSALATLTVCLPAFLIILLLSMILKNFIKNQYVQAVLNGIKPCIIGIIAATGLHMIIENAMANGLSIPKNWQSLVIMAIIIIAMFIYYKIKKKNISPIMLITVSAISGIIVYGI
jgi:chromate transporter